MTKKRFTIAYEKGNWWAVKDGDITLWKEETIALLNSLNDENEHLKNRVDELEDDNMKYTLSTDKLEEYTKRFIPTKCINEFRDCKTNRYYWLDNEDNFTGALELLNLLDCENEQLKQINRNLGDFRRFITEQNVSNEKERKNLQLQMLRLYNYFENYFEDDMSPTAFGEMWDNVKEDKKWEKR